MALVTASDPDVIENHNLHGFDLPFLDRRARRLNVPLPLGRIGPPGLRRRAARRGVALGPDGRRSRLLVPGRELIDTMDAVLRYDFATRELPGHGLKAVARHLGLAGPDREQIRGDLIHETWRTDPDRVRRYAIADVEEVAGLARMLAAPPSRSRAWRRGATSGSPRQAPPRACSIRFSCAPICTPEPRCPRTKPATARRTPARRSISSPRASPRAIVKADVASLYPSLMRAYRIGPARDRLGAMLALVDRLVEQRLAAKARARAAAAGSADRHAHEATSAAMKIVINSAYGYLGAGGDLTRFADVHAANEVTRRGRETLELMCRELAARGVTLLEADTDGVYFAVPEGWTDADADRIVSEVGALLPPLVQLELEGRYAAMLSHEPKNYALLTHDGRLLLRGVAFRSSRAEPFGEAFLKRALAKLLVGEIAGVRDVYVDTVTALRRRDVPTWETASRMRLTKTPEEYAATRDRRREPAYEALLAAGRPRWSPGDRVRVYRTREGRPALAPSRPDASATEIVDPRDYDVEHYVRLLRETFASRLARALSPEDFAAVFDDPGQLSLFAPAFTSMQTVLTRLAPDDVSTPPPADDEEPRLVPEW